MPHSNKRIQSGSLNEPVSPSRAHTWTKHGGPGGQTGFEDVPADADDDIEVEVEDGAVAQRPGSVAEPTKYASRGSTARYLYDDDYVETSAVEVEKQWIVTRSIHGRIYTRSDAATYVEVTPGTSPS